MWREGESQSVKQADSETRATYVLRIAGEPHRATFRACAADWFLEVFTELGLQARRPTGKDDDIS